MDHAYAVLGDMVANGAVSTDERARMALGVWPRRRRDLLAPFRKDGRYRNLTVEYCEASELPDPAWVDYERDGNKEALVNKHADHPVRTVIRCCHNRDPAPRIFAR
jgi:hypothetical protein